MGEEAKQEEAKAASKQEEKGVEEKEKGEEKKEEENAPPPPPPPPPPVVLFVDMHCVGCAKRVESCIMKVRGVEEVSIDAAQNQVTIKGIVDPQAICMRIERKTKRKAIVLSPLPPPDADPTKPQVVTSQVSGVTTVILHINMHCEACAEQLKRKILKMRGVQSAETDLNTGKVAITGTIDAGRLVDYIYRRTRKFAVIIPPPEQEKKECEEAAKEPEKTPEEQQPPAKTDDKNEEERGKPVAVENAGAEKKEEEKPPIENGGEGAKEVEESTFNNEDMARKIMYCPPSYVIERVPPPQLFSDENPNACCIS